MVVGQRTARSWASLVTVSIFATVSAVAAPPGSATAPTIEDIVEAVSIDSLTLAPDGSRIAFRTVTPSIAKNSIRVDWHTVDLSGARGVSKLGRTAAPLFMPFFDIVEDGQAGWDQEAKGLYVLLPDHEQGTQIYRLSMDGREIQITHDKADVVDFKAGNVGATIAYRVRNSRAEIDQAQRQEDLSGVHLDRSIYPEGLRLTRSFPVNGRMTTLRRRDAAYAGEAFEGPLQTKHMSVDHALAAQPARPSTSLELTAATVDGAFLPPSHTGLAFGISRVNEKEAATPIPAFVVSARLANGKEVRCKEPVCHGLPGALRQVIRSPDGNEAIILYERDFSGLTGIYAWDPRRNRTRVLVAPSSSLSGGSSYSGAGCVVAGQAIYCVEASATEPPRLIEIHLGTGRRSTLFDPNAGLRAKRFLKTDFIEWHDHAGRPWNGFLTRPLGSIKPVPLVITSYRCRGFLRGGTANLAPEQLLARRGMAALCVNLNTDTAVASALSRIPAQTHQASTEGYRAAVDLLVSEGLVDRTKVGIAGHSYSAMTAAYAVSHSNLFATAVLGTGITIDPAAYFLTAPTSDSWRKNVLTSMHLPHPQNDPNGIWHKVSPALNADKIAATLLLQPPENEWLFGLQLYTYLQDAGGTVDMFVYPGAGHMFGRLPAQQYSRARRSIDWFRFWLMNEAAVDHDSAAQFAHWDDLRNARKSNRQP